MGAPTGYPGGLNSPSIGGGWTAVPGRVFYVGNRSGLPSSNGKDPDHPFATLNAALAKTVANRGDAIRILPGHVEAITTADQMSNLVAGTLIEGYGVGNQRGILRWSAAGATFLLDVAGTVLRNLRLQMAGDPAATAALTVAAPITVSAAGCAIQNCQWQVGVDADQIVTIALTTTAAADDLLIENNYIIGDPTALITATGTVIRLVGADGCIIRNNYISAGLATATDGLIETLTTASLNLDINNNFLSASGANDTCVLDFGAAIACTGSIRDNLCVVDVDATAGTVVFTKNAANNMALNGNNLLVNDNNERGLVFGTASA